MKILHVPFSYPPDPPGGTEVYVAGLCTDLAALGLTAVVAAPAPASASYVHKGVPVRRFAMTTGNLPLEQMYGDGDPVAASAFARILDAEVPDVVHLHALTPACSVRLIREARRRRLPVVFTYHTPTVSCPRGTLLLNGAAPCDGRLDVTRCTACVAAAHGAPRTVAGIMSRIPPGVGDGLGRIGLSGGALTAARLSGLIRAGQEAVREVFARVDRIVTLTPWVEGVLRANGVPEQRLHACPHGTSRRPVEDDALVHDGLVRLVHLGRLHPVKGTEVLLRAFREVTDAHLRLDVVGVAQDEAGQREGQRLRDLAAMDDRVRFLPSVVPDDAVEMMSRYHAVMAPSQWMETGPLVVLEAFAAGVPVVGSRLGGIADKVAHEVDGLLVDPFDSVDAWREVLSRVATEPDVLLRLRAGVRPPRARSDVAREMAALYESLLVSPDAHGRLAGPAGVVR